MSVDILPPPGEFQTTEEIRDKRFLDKLAKRRRALLLWSLPVVVIAFLAALKLLSAVAINTAGQSAYDNQNHNTAAERFAALEFFNVIEPWKPYFNQGTAIYAGGDFFGATQEFEVALNMVPKAPEGEPRGADECTVRTNYSLAVEGLGDEARIAGDFAQSTARYTEAQDILADCGESGGNGGEQAQEAEERQQESQEQSEEQQQQQQEQQGEEPSGEPSETGTGEPSESGSESGSGEPSESGSESGSGEPSESGSESGSGEPSESGSESGSGEPSESGSGGESVDPRQEELQSRNEEAQASRDAEEQASGGGDGSGQNW
ncbi:hypothetical protein [Occultella gossypii]|uniref:Tetratricopeptide repeat-containing protein n=1 Tax=Occultella gossypii TaxID=2800820 RepID=A0ABS7SEE2_9MICO|nr:hypothetical protein [Occultella gossypii]MBZ2198723.1 hypothetical protein [Occultella gossypii]